MVAALVVALMALGTVSAWGQGADKDTDKLEQQLLQELEEGAGLIGVAAYSEVIESGRYLVGPGDQFLVAVTGVEGPLISEVLAEGGMYIPRVGLVQIGGLRLHQAHALIRETIQGKFKLGDVAVQLRQPRQFPVPVVGMVIRPGLAITSGVERVSSVIQKRGGLEGNEASRRNIRVFKAADLKKEEVEILRRTQSGPLPPGLLERSRRVDLEAYSITGRSEYDPFLEDGDIVLVPPPEGQVGVLGGLQRSGFYEYVEGDRISDMLQLALGLTPAQDRDNVVLFRYADDMKSMQTVDVDLRALLAGDATADLELKPGDWLNFREVPDYQRVSTVHIEGEVKRPGYYVLPEEGMRILDLIEVAGGMTQDASLSEARLISRRQAQEEVRDPELERIRTIAVADRSELENQYFIMKSREWRGKMVVDFAALYGGDPSQNLDLQPGDQIFVPKRQQAIVVSGQAANPGAIPYDAAYTVWDYIERAGGFGWRADTKDVLVIRADTGEIKKAKKLGRLEPGDRIWIKEKPERDYWAIFTQAVQVVGQVTTVVLLVFTVTSN